MIRKEEEDKDSVLRLELENARESLANSEQNNDRLHKQLNALQKEREDINEEAMRCMAQVEDAAAKECDAYQLRIDKLEKQVKEEAKKVERMKAQVNDATEAATTMAQAYDDRILGMEESIFNADQECDRLRRELYESERKFDDYVEQEKRKQRTAAVVVAGSSHSQLQTPSSPPNHELKKMYESRIATHVKKIEQQVCACVCVCVFVFLFGYFHAFTLQKKKKEKRLKYLPPFILKGE
jgi:chromosome segregation ATPase